MPNERNLSLLRPLPLILLAPAMQGSMLYGLHLAIERRVWPATHDAWLVALYAVTIFAPLTTQLLATAAAQRLAWLMIAVVAIADFYFGWHFGATIVQESAQQTFQSGDFVPLILVSGVAWFLALPFMQARLRGDSWIGPYPALFTIAWRNALLLGEAAAFTGFFWLLLALWQELFRMLGIGFFRELFTKPSFFYPVTSLVFGVALHLVGSIERLTAAVLEQVLNVLKWLAVIAGLILGLFTLALMLKLPALVFEGHRAIGTAWLLWLIAVTVLLINAAYRDGSVERPYPQWIAVGLRYVVLLTVIIAITALYALFVRTRHYGLTVERVWAWIVALTAGAYAFGYAFAAVRRGKWFGAIDRVNVYIALGLLAVLALTLTPLASPYRLAANSQARIALAVRADRDNPMLDSALRYLRFDAGRYGVRRLEELSRLQGEESMRTAVQSLLKTKNRWEAPQIDSAELLAALQVFPANRRADADLLAMLKSDLELPTLQVYVQGAKELVGIFVDLHGDAQDEFVLLYPRGGTIYQLNGGKWRSVGQAHMRSRTQTSWNSTLENLRNGNMSVVDAPWKDFTIGTQRFRAAPNAADQ